MSETVYLKLSQNTEVHDPDVYLSQVGTVWCQNKSLESKCRAIKLLHIKDKESKRYIFSVMNVIELIGQVDEKAEVNNIGETDFIIDYQPNPHKIGGWDWIKTIFVCLSVFVGGAFAIMTFNNDANVTEVFGRFYELVMGTRPQGMTLIDVSYAVGLPTGILLFFNHLSRWQFSKDPTPIEVQMRTYEQDVNTTLIQNGERKESGVDVS